MKERFYQRVVRKTQEKRSLRWGALIHFLKGKQKIRQRSKCDYAKIISKREKTA